MKILVTGAAGFIGHFVTRALLERGDEVVGFDSINEYYDPELKYHRLAALGIPEADIPSVPSLQAVRSGSFIFYRNLLEDHEAVSAVFKAHRFDCVIHLAAQAGVRYSIDNPRAYMKANLDGFLNILEACREQAVPHLAYASSSSVYGMNRKVPFSEKDGVDHPVSLYAATKRANELMAHSWSNMYGLPTTGMRFFTVYGPMGRPDMAYFKFADAIRTGKPVDIYNNGELWRDFTYIDDVVKAVLLIADRPPAGDAQFDPEHPCVDTSSAPWRVYNIGNSSPVKLSEFISVLEESLGCEALKRFAPMQAGDVYMTAADTASLERIFNWKPCTAISEGLMKFAHWYKEYTSWQQ